ncbi:hypothetical protein KIN20_004533 [Parelaphostrongylus tenuis]|uniref:ZP domain-containing protein n=1 Tax=Parelaphostrongylus tenuis TaxID=148309 RepID=A0AAD5MK28_PARTN|nr:hypothetical protein KIN20_004533 [Parelaphostrongylus tenuis]
MMLVLVAIIVSTVVAWINSPPPQLDNGIAIDSWSAHLLGLQRGLQHIFHTDSNSFFFKAEKDSRLNNNDISIVPPRPTPAAPLAAALDLSNSRYVTNTKPEVTFELHNGDCNMRRTRMLGPEQRGMEQSITVIISFHSTFITKVDKAYRCTCFYMEADEVVSSRFDVSVLPTTDLIDSAQMPVCTYTVRRDSISGPLVQYAKIGDPVYHVWQCESDMFSMLVHSCFVDDSNGNERKVFIDEHGCAVDPIIVPDPNYNKRNNLAYSQVNVFSFADKAATEVHNSTSSSWIHPHNTMDVSAQKITVLDLEETAANQESDSRSYPAATPMLDAPEAACMSSKVAVLFTTAAAAWTTITTPLVLYIVLKYKKACKTYTTTD